ncbi:MAG: hypothetical protein M1826_007744 [Phylliscum demangeonii]|nr:MAG: hypothetical protein M1826_007744 [Phylliscum demangeonii]
MDAAASTLSRMMGGRHCHAEVRVRGRRLLLATDADWMRGGVAGGAELEYMLRCEAASLLFLARESCLPTPTLHDWALEGGANKELGPGYILMDKLPGKALVWRDLRQESAAVRQHLLTQLVDLSLELERHPLPSIASLTSLSPLTMGGMAHPSVVSGPGPLAPSNTCADAYRSRLQAVLDQMVTGELVEAEPANDGPAFYLKQPDDKGDHILVDDMFNITGIIDWEWCTSASKEYAFASPCMMWPLKDFYASSNRLAEEERQLADLCRQLGRDDLAQVVLAGRALQRFWFLLEQVFSQDRDTGWALFKGLLSASDVELA